MVVSRAGGPPAARWGLRYWAVTSAVVAALVLLLLGSALMVLAVQKASIPLGDPSDPFWQRAHDLRDAQVTKLIFASGTLLFFGLVAAGLAVVGWQRGEDPVLPGLLMLTLPVPPAVVLAGWPGLVLLILAGALLLRAGWHEGWYGARPSAPGAPRFQARYGRADGLEYWARYATFAAAFILLLQALWGGAMFVVMAVAGRAAEAYAYAETWVPWIRGGGLGRLVALLAAHVVLGLALLAVGLRLGSLRRLALLTLLAALAVPALLLHVFAGVAAIMGAVLVRLSRSGVSAAAGRRATPLD